MFIANDMGEDLLAARVRSRHLMMVCSALSYSTLYHHLTVYPVEVYAETRNNEKLAHAYQIFMARAFGDKIQLEGVNTASTDFGTSATLHVHILYTDNNVLGNVCYKLPGFHPMFDIPSEEGSSNHTPGFADAARTPEAHNCAIKAAKGLAVIAAKFVTDDNFANETKQAFEKLKEEVGNSEGQSKKE